MDSKTASGRNEHDGYPEPAAKIHRFADFTRVEEASICPRSGYAIKTKQSSQY